MTVLVSLVFFSCNKNFDRMIGDKEFPDPELAGVETKVLYIIADGARGESVRDARPANILSLLPNSIYSWNALGDSLAINATGWADLMTGVQKDKHEITSDNFSGNALEQYPVIFKHIKEVTPDKKIVAFASNATFKNNLTTGADVSQLFATDAEVKNAVVSNLGQDTATLVAAQFSGIDLAGQQAGYDVSKAAYKNAITQFDGYVGEMLKAMRERENYANERWLVVIASNKGGMYATTGESDNSVFSDPKLNTFTIFYNSAYRTTFINKPYLGNRYTGSSFRLTGLNANAINAKLAPTPDLNFGDTTSFTISLKIKKNRNAFDSYSYQWPGILGNRMAGDWWGNRGWNIDLVYDRWGINIGPGGSNKEPQGMNFDGGSWHDLTVVCIRKENGKRYLRCFTDGVRYTDGVMGGETELNDGNIDTSDPITLGFVPGNNDGERGNLNVNISEVRVFRTALPDSIVTQFACDATLDSGHPYYDYLIAYWPMQDGQGNILKDAGPFGHDFTINGNYQWEIFNDYICSPSATNLATLVPKNADVVSQILNWMRISPKEAWQLDGRVWLEN